MTSIIYLVRHAESEHNVSKDFSKLDPSLTSLGQTQATKLVNTLPCPERIGVVLTSPLRRAIQTTLAGFSHVLDKRYFDPSSGLGVETGLQLILDPDLQERSNLPCDTGSERQVLDKDFLNLDLKRLSDDWQAKVGPYAADDFSVTTRAARMRGKLEKLSEALQNEEKRDIVVVTHGVFMKFLSEEEDIDLPKAEWKAFTVSVGKENRAILTPATTV